MMSSVKNNAETWSEKALALLIRNNIMIVGNGIVKAYVLGLLDTVRLEDETTIMSHAYLLVEKAIQDSQRHDSFLIRTIPGMKTIPSAEVALSITAFPALGKIDVDEIRRKYFSGGYYDYLKGVKDKMTRKGKKDFIFYHLVVIGNGKYFWVLCAFFPNKLFYHDLSVPNCWPYELLSETEHDEFKSNRSKAHRSREESD